MVRDPYKYFRIEAREIVDEMGKGMLALEQGGGAPDLVNRLLRLAHTLKGAARVVKQAEIAEHAHTIEDVLGPLRDGGAVSPGDIDRVLGLVDAIGGRIDGLDQPAAPNVLPGVAPASVPQEPVRVLRADRDDMDALLDGVSEVGAQLMLVRTRAGTVDQARRLVDQLASQVANPNRSDRTTSATAQALRELIDELDRELVAGLDQTERELKQVRDTAERLRLVPARELVGPLERTARDAAVSLGKRVRFVATGGEVTLDADVLGAIQGALLQAVRNAVAHGIEPPAVRTGRGKPAEGTVTLDVIRRGNRVAFRCRDDGAGVDLAAVRRAVRRSERPTDEIDRLDSAGLLELLLQGGITTSGVVTEMSGRGIGLDLIREAAARLGGTAAIRTEARVGTEVEIVVPITRSALDVLVVEVADQKIALPLGRVRQTLRIRAADVTRDLGGDSIIVDDRIVPFVPLARALRLDRGTSAPDAWSAVVIAAGDGSLAVGVDRLVGTENVIVRSLPDAVPIPASIGGVSLDLEGNPQIVVDPDGLLAAVEQLGPSMVPAAPLRAPILVIDDSLTTRMMEQSILESAGYTVELATSAEEGLEMARARRYALFLVDVEMPGMDGFTFIQRSRADPALQHTPAILVTSRAAPEDLARGEAVGASGHIAKGEFDQSKFLDRIRALVG